MFECPNCHHGLDVDRKSVGMAVGCPRCGRQVIVEDPTLSRVAAPRQPAGRTVAFRNELQQNVQSIVYLIAGYNPTQGSGNPKIMAGGILVNESCFREAVRIAVKRGVVIVALAVAWGVLSFLPLHGCVGGITVGDWVATVIMLGIAGTAIMAFRSVKTIVTFSFASLLNVGRSPDRDTFAGNLVGAAATLTLAAYVVSLSVCLMPYITLVCDAFMRISFLTTCLNVSLCLAVVGILFVFWKDAQPLVDLLTGSITDRVSPVSDDSASVFCPACRARNDRNAAFCISCGGAMKAATLVMPISRNATPSGMASGYTKHVFISHSSQNRAWADRTCAVLESHGLSCWIAPRDVQPGAPYDEEILRGIECSQTFILLLSEAANASDHVKRELMCALRTNHTVYPVRIQEVQPGPKLEYLLEGIHWVDAWTPPFETHLERLFQLITAQNPVTDNARKRTSAGDERSTAATTAAAVPAD